MALRPCWNAGFDGFRPRPPKGLAASATPARPGVRVSAECWAISGASVEGPCGGETYPKDEGDHDQIMTWSDLGKSIDFDACRGGSPALTGAPSRRCPPDPDQTDEGQRG